MNYKKMLQDIDDIVTTDFCMWMDAKMDKHTYTQEEAKQMADIIGKVYLISHCIHCSWCSNRYNESNHDPDKLWWKTLPNINS